MGRVRDGKKSRDLGIEHDNREDVGVLWLVLKSAFLSLFYTIILHLKYQ